jgi:hypothetical protein
MGDVTAAEVDGVVEVREDGRLVMVANPSDWRVLLDEAAASSPGIPPEQTAEGEESEGARTAVHDVDPNEAVDDASVAPASRGTATPHEIFFVTVGGTSTDVGRKLPELSWPWDPFDELRRMGEEDRARPLTDNEAAMLSSIKIAVLGEPSEDEP